MTAGSSTPGGTTATMATANAPTNERGKGVVYLDILNACYDRIPAGGPVLAHNSVNCAKKLSEYLTFVRDSAHFTASVNIVVDPEGLEAAVK